MRLSDHDPAGYSPMPLRSPSDGHERRIAEGPIGALEAGMVHPKGSLSSPISRHTVTRKILRMAVLLVVGIASLVAATTPAPAITGGSEDTGNIFSNVGMLVFYQPD